MKFVKINDADYQLLFLTFVSSEEEILAIVKKFFQGYQKKFELKGFYRVVVFNRTFGLLLQIIQVNDTCYSDTIDYRIVFDDESKFYFQTNDYFIVEKCRYVYYFDENFYALVDDSFDKILEKVEFGNFVLESSLDFLHNCDLIFHK